MTDATATPCGHLRYSINLPANTTTYRLGVLDDDVWPIVQVWTRSADGQHGLLLDDVQVTRQPGYIVLEWPHATKMERWYMVVVM